MNTTMTITEFVAQYDQNQVSLSDGSYFRVNKKPNDTVAMAVIQYDPATAEAVLTALGVNKIDPFERLCKKHGFDVKTQTRSRPGGGGNHLRIDEYNATVSITVLNPSGSNYMAITDKITIEHADRILTAMYSEEGKGK